MQTEFRIRGTYFNQTSCSRLDVPDNNAVFCSVLLRQIQRLLLVLSSESSPLCVSWGCRTMLGCFQGVSLDYSPRSKGQASPFPLSAWSVWASSTPLCICSPDTNPPPLWGSAKQKVAATTSRVSLCYTRKWINFSQTFLAFVYLSALCQEVGRSEDDFRLMGEAEYTWSVQYAFFFCSH